MNVKCGLLTFAAALVLRASRRLAESLAPGLARGASFGRPKEVLQGHVHEPALGVGEELFAVPELAPDVQPPAPFVAQLC